MSHQISIKFLRNQVSRLDQILHDNNLISPSEHLVMSEGSAVNGIAYRLWTGREGSTCHFVGSNGYLGMTKKDASNTLDTIIQAITGVLWIQKNPNVLKLAEQ